MIPHEAFDLSNLNDGDGVGSHFGDGTRLWRSCLARRRALLRTVFAFLALENENTNGALDYCSRYRFYFWLPCR